MLSQDKKSRFAFNGTALALIAAFGPGLVFGPSAQAQAPTPTPTPKASTAPVAVEDDVEEIVVTGTSVRGVAAVGSEAITLSREDIEATGMTSVGQVLGTLTQFQNNIAGGNTETPGPVQNVVTQPTFGGNTSGINGINLRGLGNGATMVLINGFRSVASGGESVVDPNTIPISALQRIDVVADGVSAVYGSDAVAGVVNFILRKDYRGVEGGARYSWQEGSSTKGASITMGTGWDFLRGGNVLLTLDYDHRDALPANTKPYYMDDKRAVGGNNAFGLLGATTPPSLNPYISYVACPTGQTVIPAQSPPNFLPNATCSAGGTITASYLAINGANFSPTSTAKPTAAQVLAGGAPVFVDQGNYTDFLGQRIQRSATLVASQELNDIFTLRMQATYSSRDTKTRGGLAMQTSAINGTSPLRIAGSLAPAIPDTVNTPAPNTLTTYNLLTPLGVRINRNINRTLTSATSLEFKLPGDWQGEAAYTYNFNRDFGTYRARGDGLVIGGAASVRAYQAGEFNPFSNTNVITDSSSFAGYSQNKTRDIYTAYRLKFDGPLFTLPGGEIKAALGAQYSEERSGRDAYTWADRGTPPVYSPGTSDNDVGQDITSYFAEVHIPLVSEMNRFPLMESLNFSAAVRRDDYSSFGETTNPHYGLDWEPVKDLKLRATYGTAFKSPGLNYSASNPLDINVVLNAGTVFPNSTTAPSPYASLGSNVQAILFVGRRNEMDPETSKNKQLGFDYTPSWLDGLKVSGTWYSIDYKNRIDSPNYRVFLTSNANADAFSTNIYLLTQNITNPNRCLLNNRADPQFLDPLLYSLLGPDVTDRFITGATTPSTLYCTAPVIFDGRFSNLARQVQEGYDLSVNYRKDVDGVGQLSGGFTLTKITKVEASSNNGAQLLPNVVDVIGGVLSTRARANLGWSNAGFNAQLSANYTGAYINDRLAVLGNQTVQPYEIGSNLTYDLNVGYRFNDDVGPLSNLRASLSVVNLLDNDPPYAFTGASVYDASYADPYGRIFSLRLTKEF